MKPVGTLQIRCPPMVVRNTGWSPWSLRMADELPCDGHAEIEEQQFNFPVIFPETPVRRLPSGMWQVDPCIAGNEEHQLEISYPAEQVKDISLRLKAALAIENNVAQSWIVLGGIRYGVHAPLKETLADAGWLFGLFSYTVRATVIEGELLE